MTAGDLIAFLQTVPADTLVVADDRFVACDVEPKLTAVRPDTEWAAGAYIVLGDPEDHAGATIAVVL